MSEPTAHTGDISAREVFVGDVLVALCKDVESAAEIVRRWNAAIPTEAAQPSEGPRQRSMRMNSTRGTSTRFALAERGSGLRLATVDIGATS